MSSHEPPETSPAVDADATEPSPSDMRATSDADQGETHRFRVDAAGHRRRSSLTHVTLSGKIDRPLLQRPDRSRPTPCQGEYDAATDRTSLWWLTDPLGAEESYDVDLRLGVRQRSTPARVKVAPSATGWVVSIRERRSGEVLLSKRGVPQLSLLDDRGRLATVTHRARSFGEALDPTRGAARQRVRRGQPIACDGAVVGTVAGRFAQLDEKARVNWMESHCYRFLDGDEKATIIDATYSWQATTGPIPLALPHSVPASRPCHLPVLRLALAGGARVSWFGDLGWKGQEEIAAHPSWIVLAMSEHRCLALVLSSSTWGQPPRWRFVGNRSVEALASPGLPGASQGDHVQLPLGSSLTLRYRLLSFPPTDDALDFAREQLLDAEYPPRVRPLEEPAERP
ncbi:hypothetical protein Pan216_02310 [Planctomycetes bacterium Pan216]|uniref:Uncharacterized protein n=1 Tax=Kolteria novifilia TaxID=2527975 RepID=A0A518AXF4_9BACT|nr:hypothetical protein Pan216_02310 [Planctomycetes bacterium Pan216]